MDNYKQFGQICISDMPSAVSGRRVGFSMCGFILPQRESIKLCKFIDGGDIYKSAFFECPGSIDGYITMIANNDSYLFGNKYISKEDANNLSAFIKEKMLLITQTEEEQLDVFMKYFDEYFQNLKEEEPVEKEKKKRKWKFF